MNSQTATTISNINIQNSIEDLILVLNDKEKNVLTKRFSLDNKSKETLEKIWWRFNITRERVRQIENNALNKLKRVVKSSNLSELNKRAEEVILNEWWVILEEKLIASLLNELKDNRAVDWNLIKLSLSINWEISSNQRWSELKKFWKFNEVKNEDIDKINAAWYNILKEKWDLNWIPNWMHTVCQSCPEKWIESWVIFVLKNINNNINIENTNQLHPFYLVYIKEDWEVLSNHLNVKNTLDILRSIAKWEDKPIKEVYNLFNEETSDWKNMDKYSDLLNQSIDSILHVKDETDIESLFTPWWTTALINDIKWLNDFELITFVIIK